MGARRGDAATGAIRRALVALVLLATVAAAGCSVTATSLLPPQPGVTIHVAPHGDDTADGSAQRPLRTIAAAVERAPDAATIVLHAGRYHESVPVYDRRLRIVGAPGEQVVLDGASTVTGWQRRDTAWVAPWSVRWPTTLGGQIDPANPLAARPDMVFVDDRPLRQVATPAEVVPGSFAVDESADLLWIGDDPEGHEVAASDLPWALWFNAADGSELGNVTIRRYATPAVDMAALRIDSVGVSVSDVVVEHNAYSGVFAIGAGHRLTRLIVRNNAYIGISGHEADGLTISQSTVSGNNRELFDPSHSGAGIKVTESDDVSVHDCDVVDNAGVGIWTDIGVSHAVIVGNLVRRSARSGIMLELTGHAVVADNVVDDAGSAGIRVLESNDVDVWNNAVLHAERGIWLQDGPRTSAKASQDVIWDLQRVTLRNNVVGDGRPGAEVLVAADDWTERRPAADMDISVDTTAYWTPVGNPTHLSRWARWPEPLAISDTLAAHQSATGQDANGLWSSSGDHPFARDPGGFDHRTPPGTPPGSPATRTVAEALGVAEGSPLPIGPRQHLLPSTRGVVVA